MNPERIKGLVVIDIAPVTYTDDEPHWKAVIDIIKTLKSVHLSPGMSRRDVDMQLQQSITDPALRAFVLTNYDTAKGEWKMHLDSIASQLDVLAGFDIEPNLEFSGDAFFIHGGQSRFVRHKHIDAIANHFPNHMLTTIRGAGHWVRHHSQSHGFSLRVVALPSCLLFISSRFSFELCLLSFCFFRGTFVTNR